MRSSCTLRTPSKCHNSARDTMTKCFMGQPWPIFVNFVARRLRTMTVHINQIHIVV